MIERTCLIGFDESESRELASLLPGECVAFEMLPRLLLKDGVLRVQSRTSWDYVPVSRVVFHGIFENDTDFLAALCLWGGPCYPNPVGMVDCRLRLPALAKAVRLSRFGGPSRSFVSAGVRVVADQPLVAKWGNWHCGHDKERITGEWTSEFAGLLEPYFEGEAVRVTIIRNQAW
ncbi:hypothetical protein [Zavarzinella formosa]|uniref:hypothetical protein n=1 Tax=Zavarzinella formosa TaxID=360055 RepID=UPI0002E45B1B|nr:hypothetical protein [Zavarzinella formosa]